MVRMRMRDIDAEQVREQLGIVERKRIIQTEQ